MRVFPPSVVDEAIAQAGRTQRRSRVLTARVTAYFTIAMALNPDGSYEDVFADLVDGLSWASGWNQEFPAATASAIFQARARLGSQPIEQLFKRVARPLARPDWEGSWLCGKRVLAIDGTTLDLANSSANVAAFGQPGTTPGERAAHPGARVVAIAECGTNAVIDAVIGPCSLDRTTLPGELLERLPPGVVLIADQRFSTFELWRRAAAGGTGLLVLATHSVTRKHVATLADGTWLAEISPPSGTSGRNEPLTVRVIDCAQSTGEVEASSFLLLTTLTDPDEAPVQALVGAYLHRWRIEHVFDELRTNQHGPRIALRSKSPDLVRQEIWGHLCCHYAIRTLMASPPTHAKEQTG